MKKAIALLVLISTFLVWIIIHKLNDDKVPQISTIDSTEMSMNYLFIDSSLLLSMNDRLPSDTFKIDAGTFPLIIRFVITEDTTKALAYIKQYYPATIASDISGNSGLTLFGYKTIVWLKRRQDDIAIHELLHVDLCLLDYVGIKMNPYNQEIYTYELQYLFLEYKYNAK